MNNKVFSAILIGIMATSAISQNQIDNNSTVASPAASFSTQDVDKIMQENKLQAVGYEYVKDRLGDGTVKNSKIILIDARPEKRFEQGHIPTSINIPDTQVDKYIGQLATKSKDAEIVTYCQGPTCEKSSFLAIELKKRGFRNVKVYRGGTPEWEQKNFLDIGTVEVAKLLNENKILLIDARPFPKFKEETIIGAISIPDTKLNEMLGRLPKSYEEKIVIFCGGVECDKSFFEATKLYEMGYKKVAIYSQGLPGYKSAGLPTTISCTKNISSEKDLNTTKMSGPIKLGADDGVVDTAAFKELIKNIPPNVNIVDVRAADVYAKGHIKGAINIPIRGIKPIDFANKLPSNGYIILTCATGTMSLDAYLILKDDAKYKNIDKVFYLDAQVSCNKEGCNIK
jgi:rhodanese-related sulfurtransferase